VASNTSFKQLYTMIPIGDAERRPLGFSTITAVLITLNILTFILELVGGSAFIDRWSLVPADIISGKNYLTIFTSMFLHEGIIHIAGNMLFFWVFGPEIEDVMGPARYLVFYLLGGLASTLAQVAVNPLSDIPNLGASGAIAAVMGVFLVTFPRDRIKTVVLLGWFTTITMIPAVVLVGVWFLTQVFSEIGSFTNQGGVAYMAHIGGFIFGAIIGRFFESQNRLSQQENR
jgi:membrane associated rhomboid family serine protease